MRESKNVRVKKDVLSSGGESNPTQPKLFGVATLFPFLRYPLAATLGIRATALCWQARTRTSQRSMGNNSKTLSGHPSAPYCHPLTITQNRYEKTLTGAGTRESNPNEANLRAHWRVTVGFKLEKY